MWNYRKNDYAANKYSPNIVYRFNDEIIEISLEDYLEENPDRTEQDFLKLKALSDEIYYEQDRAENTQTRKNISIQGMEEMNCCATRSLEDEWEEFEVERQNYRYAKLALGQLFTTVDIYGHLQYATKKQSAAAIEQDIVTPMVQNLSADAP